MLMMMIMIASIAMLSVPVLVSKVASVACLLPLSTISIFLLVC